MASGKSVARFWMSAVCVVVCALALVSGAHAMSLMGDSAAAASEASKPQVTLALVENPELVARVLDSLLRSVIYSANVDLSSSSPLSQAPQKRGLDLGISRGYSGSQAGKHLMGLSAASFANGPGRR